MDKQVEFPKFLAQLKDMGIEANGVQFLESAQRAWETLPAETRVEFLHALGVTIAKESVNDVALRLAKRPGARKTIENVFVVLRIPEEEAKAGPAAESPATQAASPGSITPPPATPPAPPVIPQKKGLLGRFRKKEAPTEAPALTAAVTEIPPITAEHVKTLEVYPVQDPYAFVRILYDEERHEHLYQVLEPELVERERNILSFIEDTLVDVIEIGLGALSEREAALMLRKQVDEVIYDYSITLEPISKEKLMYYILRDFLGFGRLDAVMRDDLIEDISCDGPAIPLFMYHRKYESVRSTVQWPNADELDGYVIRMAQRSGKSISIAEPLLDATLPDGSRLNATLGDEVTSKGSTFTIRKFREDPFTVTDLVRFGTMSPEILAYWWMAVQSGASAIYAGGTASGKTTGLNAILLFIPPQMKIVSIEDTRELNLPHPNWIAGVTRPGFGPRDTHGRQAGEIDMFTLLKAALRQRPEYILVGEVRGQEAYALFQAMATGHTAYGTMHADSVESVIHRLESDPISIPRSLLESLDIVSVQIQTRIGEKRVRRTKEIVEVVGLDPHTREILTNEVFTWNPARDKFEFSGVSYVLERIQLERNMTEGAMHKELEQRREIIDWMVRKNVRELESVGALIVQYYKDPESLVTLAREDRDFPKPKPRPAIPAYLQPSARDIEEAAEARAQPDAKPPQNGAAENGHGNGVAAVKPAPAVTVRPKPEEAAAGTAAAAAPIPPPKKKGGGR
ncbi:MAG: type II/IV secretion system ATPase subunit [Thermoplasmatota archaeon]